MVGVGEHDPEARMPAHQLRGPVAVVGEEEVVHGVLLAPAAPLDDLLFPPAELLHHASRFTRLRPGDLVLTGTPAGVGAGRDPQRFLTDGQVLETEISGIGLLRNTIRISS